MTRKTVKIINNYIDKKCIQHLEYRSHLYDKNEPLSC